MARQDHRSRRASPGGDLLPAVGRIAVVARASTTRSAGRRPETQRDELAAPDSFDWTHSGRFVDCSDADAASFSHQASIVGLLWFGVEDFDQRGIPNCGGPAETFQEIPAIRGLNANHNHDLKNIFKGAATRAAAVAGPFQEFYAALVARGMKPPMARLTLARKIAAIILLVWKKGVRFDAEHLKQQAA